ncbi:MAG: c-type cytochrome [Fluviicola sp.]|nr:c-type cytochrome [Fluviicola sp.]
MNKLNLSILVAFSGILFWSFGPDTVETENADVKNWIAPASANKLKNPYKGSASATAKGKKLFKQMCAICHGNYGKGDGMAGASLTPRPTNFHIAKVQNQSDGAIFWKLTEGRAPMASYKTILTKEQRWQLVSFIRTFKK